MTKKNKQIPKIDNPEIYFQNTPMKSEVEPSPKQKRYWKSLDVLENTHSHGSVEKRASEFMETASPESQVDLDSMPANSRRKFLALMTASGVFSLAACSDYRDKGQIVNYVNKPESIQPGIANYYASTLTDIGRGWGVLIKTREGRPIYLTGNPEHPINQGKINAKAHAIVMDLYDTNRLKRPKINGNDSDWKKADTGIVSALNSAQSSGKEIAILAHSSVSPTQQAMFADFKMKYPNANVYGYELFDDNNRQSAWKKSYGSSENFPKLNLDKAKIILSIDSDFLSTDGDEAENLRMYAEGRNNEDLDNFSRIYTSEAAYSVTGANSDYRFKVSPENQYDFVMSLINEFSPSDPAVNSKVSSYNLDKFAKTNGLNAKVINQLVADIKHNKGKSIVLAGKQLPEDLHLAVNMLNEVIDGVKLYNRDANVHVRELSNNVDSLIQNMNSGNVGVLINFDTNPAYHFSDDLKFAEASKKVADVITFVSQENETSELSKYILPINHTFESWGDAYARRGVMSLQQPVISELYDTRQKEAAMLNWINDEEYTFDMYHKYLMNYWEQNVYPKVGTSSGFQDFWFSALHDGVLKFNDPAPLKETNAINVDSFTSSSNNVKQSGFTLILQESSALGDGRFANNGFLLETPHPITKITWDNYISVSPKVAKDNNLTLGSMVEVAVNGRTLKLPTVVQPGTLDTAIAVELGYGRTKIGAVGENVGFNANKFQNTKDGFSKWIYTGATIKATGENYELATTQEHHDIDDQFLLHDQPTGMEDGVLQTEKKQFQDVRGIIKEATVDEYKHDPEIIHHHKHSVFSITENFEYNDVKWAMAIDQNKCMGCNACVTACNVENNVPVVGKHEVLRGREMQWMRIDRYYDGSPEEPQTSMQPMLCQHCDNAPCENVCPVVATTHSPDGLNQMIYNRCVGTRYCANNCPYKVRRYNFYDFREKLAEGYYLAESFKYMHNPEVTVRSRGVMEKCDFCIERIMEERQIATEKGETFDGSTVVSACQEACPTSAIYFGNANDPKSDVAKLRKHNLGYGVLDFLNVIPNVTYLARLKNKTEGSNHHKEVNSSEH